MNTNTQRIAGRYFIVGCERSGTTLLQAMLAKNSRVFTIPESHFFCRIVPRNNLYRSLGIAKPMTAAHVVRELADRCLGQAQSGRSLPKRSPFIRSYAKAFSRLLDDATIAAGGDVWIDKTPHHLEQIDSITKWVPAAKFIHILRDGRDVTASIRDASNSDPDYWGEWSVDRLYDHWNRSVRISLKYQRDSTHYFIGYENLITNPTAELAALCDFMEIETEPGMLKHWEAAEQVTGWMASRPWMELASQPIQDTRLKKFNQVFTQTERDYLRARLIFSGSTRHSLMFGGNAHYDLQAPATVASLETS